LAGLIAGGLQWYVLGAVWDRIAGKRTEAEPFAAPDPARE
jgi:hypothetical protein